MDGLLPDERERLILARLRTQGRVLAAELAAELGTSEHTIRRHLRDLTDAGHCRRVYGGALLISPADRPVADRLHENVARKAALATTAASIVRPGQLLLLDAGTTNIAIAAALPDNASLTVVTNSPRACAQLIDRPGFDVILIGGRVGRQAGGAVGSTALLQVQQIKADLCFLGACALDPVEGIAAFDAEDAELKRAMIQASSLVAVAMTSEKLMTSAPFVVAPAAAIDTLIVEAGLAEKRVAELKKVCDTVMVARS
ncbi:DeoR/GlpR family DNA-binding transcription regulator [Burkholderia alba]|uniref:DeoR/GlpR family DNA-binding transcription regulator n=1 Tax=Burkholderia alba TaxID=2683677 RepID=UPI002B05D5F6|nr:DeoR/GlpR family DNA-binding transcription regulator [Burkholderia alba]